MILREKTPISVRVVGTCLAVFLAVVALPGWSQEPPTPPPPPPNAGAPATPDKSAIEAGLQKTVSIEFENIHVSEVLEFISDSYDINVVLDSRVVKPAPKHGLAVPIPAVSGNQTGPRQIVHVISTGQPQAPTQSTSEPSKSPYVTDGMVVALDLKNVPLADALEALLRPLNLTFQVEPHLVFVSSPAMLKADAAQTRPAPNFEDRAILQVLQANVSLEFENIHINEIVQFISDSYNVNIVTDSRAIAPRQASITDLANSSYVTDGRVRYIHLKNLPLAEALDALLRPLHLTYSPDKGFLWISSFAYIRPGVQPAESQAAGSSPLSEDLQRLANAVQAAPEDGAACAALADALVSHNHIGEAIKYYREALKSHDKDKALLTRFAAALTEFGQSGEAEKFYNDALEIDPHYVPALVNSVSLLLTLGKLDEAGARAQEAIDADPTCDAARRALVTVQQKKEKLEKNPAAPSTLEIISIRDVAGKPRAQVSTGQSTKWYNEGDAFEDYRIVQIDPAKHTATIHFDKEDITRVFPVKEK